MIVIITCVDPRVTGRIESSLGLPPGEAYIIRVGGARFAPNGEVMRDLRMLAELFPLNAVCILGHTDCRAARVADVSEEEIVTEGLRVLSETPWLTDEVQVRGVILDLGSGDIREVNP